MQSLCVACGLGARFRRYSSKCVTRDVILRRFCTPTQRYMVHDLKQRRQGHQSITWACNGIQQEPRCSSWFSAHTISTIFIVLIRFQSNFFRFYVSLPPLGDARFAETWDFDVTPTSFLQFDLNLGCIDAHSSPYSVRLEFSTDLGVSWSLLEEPCSPAITDCGNFRQGSVFHSEQFKYWKRVTIPIPATAV